MNVVNKSRNDKKRLISYIESLAFFTRIPLKIRRRLYTLFQNFIINLEKHHLNSISNNSLSAILQRYLFILIVVIGGITILYHHFPDEKVDIASFQNFQNIQSTILLGVVGLEGVFLTLYFSNINTLLGSTYSTIGKYTQKLFIESQFQNKFVRLIMLSLFWNFFSIIYMVLYQNTNKGAFWFSIILTIISIITMFEISKTSFRFLNAPTFAIETCDKILKSVKVFQFSPQWYKFIWKYIERVKVSQYLSSIEEFFSFYSQDDNLMSRQTIEFISILQNFYVLYITKKWKIPPDSIWFPLTTRRMTWNEGSSTIHYESYFSKMSLPPFPVSDVHHIEEKIFRFQNYLLSNLIKESSILNMYEVINILKLQSRVMGRELDLSETTLSIRKIFDIYMALMKDRGEENGLSITVAEGLFDLFLERLIGIREVLNQVNPEDIKRAIRSIKTQKDYQYIKIVLPTNLLYVILDIIKRSEKELQSLGHEVTPEWYKINFFYRSFRIQLGEVVEWLSKNINEFTYSSKSTLGNNDHPPKIKLSIITLGIRLYGHATFIEDMINKYLAFMESSKKDYLPPPIVKMTELSDDLLSLKDTLVNSIVDISKEESISNNIVIRERWAELFIFLGDMLFLSLKDNNLDGFKKAFPSYLILCDLVKEDLFNISQDWYVVQSVNFSIQPLLHVFTFCGFAFIWGELTKNQEFWRTMKQCWEHIINSRPEYVNFMVTSYTSLNPINMNNNYVFQVDGWNADLRKEVAKNSEIIQFDPFGFPLRENQIAHPNKFVEWFYNDARLMSIDMVGIFLAKLFEERPEIFNRLNFPSNIKELFTHE